MARKIIFSKKGLTLIEIIIALALVGIILGMTVPLYTKWKKRTLVESDTKKIYSIIQTYRMKAFTEKKSFVIKLENQNKKLNIYEGNKLVYSLELETPFSFTGNSLSEVRIDQRGTFHGSSIYANVDENVDAQYDCVAIDDIRIRLGKYKRSEGRCIAK